MTSFNYFALLTIFSFYINFTSSTLSLFTKIHYDKYTSLAIQHKHGHLNTHTYILVPVSRIIMLGLYDRYFEYQQATLSKIKGK